MNSRFKRCVHLSPLRFWVNDFQHGCTHINNACYSECSLAIVNWLSTKFSFAKSALKVIYISYMEQCFFDNFLLFYSLKKSVDIFRYMFLNVVKICFLSVYYSVFNSHLTYDSLIWQLASQTNTEELTLVEKNVYTNHPNPLFLILDIFKVLDVCKIDPKKYFKHSCVLTYINEELYYLTNLASYRIVNSSSCYFVLYYSLLFENINLLGTFCR